ncbi:MAG TPA: phosphotransferase [Planctomycetota bacterium]|jgi:hypothetical protein|nr:hypothetical protein [Planctomycetota bacterium]MDP7246143.1 phosphotransferase [Planctomycetota bacterium]MDP7559213.1 phosphotransferase [Planctomycetota bacterium]HJM39319.1 phosphotransferase [Planctomycetota bacterium]|tara:strand:+ start:34946 stop:35887 length:942 start_codon:yes stop_codon:yes gene_type:complete
MTPLLDLPLASFEPLTPEASDRRYFRAADKAETDIPWLRVETQTPPPCATAEWLTSAGVRTPRFGSAREGRYLVEDLGDIHLCHEPTPSHYEKVLRLRAKFAPHSLPTEHPNASLALDEDLFLRELALSSKHGRAPEPLCAALAHEAAKGPRQIQHRDFHSRNILLLKKDDSVGEATPTELALIDHQDLRTGPLFYDLASLWTDAYVDYSDAVRALLLEECFHVGEKAHLDPTQSAHFFLVTALQRIVKALGTFGRLLEAGRGDYRGPETRAFQRVQALLAPERAPEGLFVKPHFAPDWEKWRIFFSESAATP